jgi:hypothetical protein
VTLTFTASVDEGEGTSGAGGLAPAGSAAKGDGEAREETKGEAREH